MTRLTAKDFPQQLLEYYDYYAHGKISKREFLQLAGKYTVGQYKTPPGADVRRTGEHYVLQYG